MIFSERLIDIKVKTCRKTVKRTMTRAVVRKSSLNHDWWFVDWWKKHDDESAQHILNIHKNLRIEMMIVGMIFTPVPHLLLENHGKRKSYSSP